MDLDKFLSAALVPREAEVEVPELLGTLFTEGERAVWVVRGVTAPELARANQAGDRTDAMRSLVTALAGEGNKADEIRKAMGLSDTEVPNDVSRRIELIVAGSVSPKLGPELRDVAVKLGETFPAVFYRLSRKIEELTGQGAELGKRKRSGETPA